jgi:hypothetical protein
MTGAISDSKSEEGMLELIFRERIEGMMLNARRLIQEVTWDRAEVQLMIPMGRRVEALRSRAKKYPTAEKDAEFPGVQTTHFSPSKKRNALSVRAAPSLARLDSESGICMLPSPAQIQTSPTIRSWISMRLFPLMTRFTGSKEVRSGRRVTLQRPASSARVSA